MFVDFLKRLIIVCICFSTNPLLFAQNHERDIFSAIEHRDVGFVQHLIKFGNITVDKKNKFGETPLIVAAGNNNTEIALALLEAGANPDIQDRFGKTPLIVAAGNNNTEIVLALLEAGANPDIQSYRVKEANKKNPRELTACPGILRHGWIYHRSPFLPDANPDNREFGSIYTPHRSFFLPGPNPYTQGYGWIYTYQSPFLPGANPNLHKYGKTALMCATLNNNIEIVQALLEAGANPDIKERFFNGTALEMAIAHGYDAIAIELRNAEVEGNAEVEDEVF